MSNSHFTVLLNRVVVYKKQYQKDISLPRKKNICELREEYFDSEEPDPEINQTDLLDILIHSSNQVSLNHYFFNDR